MFNDCIALLFGLLALTFYINKKWIIGSIIYSVSVGVKMNMLLYAPGLLLVLWLSNGLLNTIFLITLCGIVQLILGYEFLIEYPIEYITKAFEL